MGGGWVVGDYGGFKIGFHMVGSCRPLSRFMLPTLSRRCFCGSPLPVSTYTSLHFSTVPVDGMLGLVGMNCYAIPRVPLFCCLFVLPNSYFQGPLRLPNVS